MSKDTYIKARVNPEMKAHFEARCDFLQLSSSQVQRDLVDNHIAAHKTPYSVDVSTYPCTYEGHYGLNVKLDGPAIPGNFVFDLPVHAGWIIRALNQQWSVSKAGEPDLGLLVNNVWEGRAVRTNADGVPLERIEYDLLVLSHRIAMQAHEAC